MDYKKELDQITETVEKQKIEKAKLEERKRKLSEDKTKILKELEELGIPEDKLEEVVEELEIELQQGVTKCQNILNGTDKETNEYSKKCEIENKKANDKWLKKHPSGTKENEC